MHVTVVVVDDDDGYRGRARLLLEATGYKVVGEAPDGMSARELVEQLHPQVVVVDVGLPDTDGFTLTRELRALPDAPQIVLISGRDATDFGPRVDSCGARGFIAKADLSADAMRSLLLDG